MLQKFIFFKAKGKNKDFGDFIPKFVSYPPPKMSIIFFPRRFKLKKQVMYLMCANTIIFLDNTGEGLGNLCFKPFVNRTPTRGEKFISTRNDTKFTRTIWGGMEGFEIDLISYPCLTTKKFAVIVSNCQ